MKKLFLKIAAWLHRHPAVKSTVVAVVGAGVTAAASGTAGTKAATIAGAVTAIGGLWTKRPVDATPADKTQ